MNGATLAPSVQVGLRHDGGDAKTGAGVEVGAGLRYSAGPLTAEGRVRVLIAHQQSGYEEWGASGAMRRASEVTPTRGVLSSRIGTEARTHTSRGARA